MLKPEHSCGLGPQSVLALVGQVTLEHTLGGKFSHDLVMSFPEASFTIRAQPLQPSVKHVGFGLEHLSAEHVCFRMPSGTPHTKAFSPLGQQPLAAGWHDAAVAG